MKATRAGWMLVVWILAASALRGDDTPLPPATLVPDQATLEKRFEQKMSGVTMTGYFTVAGKKDDGKPMKEEKYTITKVAKLRNGFWLFSARIQYGKHDATLGLPLEVKWAGDTPVITLTDYPVPGFGTFTCRVLLYDDSYAGTWSGGNTGGSMFGRLTRADDEEKSGADSED